MYISKFVFIKRKLREYVFEIVVNDQENGNNNGQ